VFYLHSRLLERAARLADKYVIIKKGEAETPSNSSEGVDGVIYGGPLALHNTTEAIKKLDNPDEYTAVKLIGSGGSLTALPIIETLLGDVSAYIPTNVISITDGQIYLEGNLFYAGIRPAVNVGLSVSRVGGDAQTKAFRQVAGRLRLDMAAFRELAAFAQFGSDLDKATQSQLNRGQHLQEILKQPQYQPLSLESQVIEIFAGIRGFADNVPLTDMRLWEISLLKYMETSRPEIGKSIIEEKNITPETEEKLTEALTAFMSTWQ
jgi:F-type H+-transporting ATPase subunit alpha